MFRHQIDIHESNQPCYSESFDLLQALAKNHIFAPQAFSLQDEHRSLWQELKKQESFHDDLALGVKRFSREVGRAVAYLNGPATLRIDPNDPREIPAALQVLDDAVILHIFLRGTEAGKNMNLPDAVKHQLELLSLELSVEHLPLCHRFIPLNDWRLKIMEEIPGQHRHHFIWYDRWSNVPEHTLTELVNHWQEITEANNLSWLDLPEILTKALLQDITSDEPFSQSLAGEARLIRKVAAVLADSVHLGLAALANSVGMDNPLPVIVTEKGVQAAACKAIGEPIINNQDKYEKILLAGLYGPDLNETKRMELFREIGAWLQSTPQVDPYSLAGHLIGWRTDPVQGRPLLDKAMQTWLDLLENSAKKMTEPVPYRAGAFEEAVANLLTAEPISLLDREPALVEQIGQYIPTLDLTAARTVIDAFCRTLFPAPRALAYAADMEAGCLCLQVSDAGQELKEIERPRVERLNRELRGSRLVLSGVIEGMAGNQEKVIELSCRYLVNNQLYHPVFCQATETGFHAEFDSCGEDGGKVYLVMIMRTG